METAMSASSGEDASSSLLLAWSRSSDALVPQPHLDNSTDDHAFLHSKLMSKAPSAPVGMRPAHGYSLKGLPSHPRTSSSTSLSTPSKSSLNAGGLLGLRREKSATPLPTLNASGTASAERRSSVIRQPVPIPHNPLPPLASYESLHGQLPVYADELTSKSRASSPYESSPESASAAVVHREPFRVSSLPAVSHGLSTHKSSPASSRFRTPGSEDRTWLAHNTLPAKLESNNTMEEIMKNVGIQLDMKNKEIARLTGDLEELHAREQAVRTDNDKLHARLAETKTAAKDKIKQSLEKLEAMKSEFKALEKTSAELVTKLTDVKTNAPEVTKMRDEIEKSLKDVLPYLDIEGRLLKGPRSEARKIVDEFIKDRQELEKEFIEAQHLADFLRDHLERVTCELAESKERVYALELRQAQDVEAMQQASGAVIASNKVYEELEALANRLKEREEEVFDALVRTAKTEGKNVNLVKEIESLEARCKLQETEFQRQLEVAGRELHEKEKSMEELRQTFSRECNAKNASYDERLKMEMQTLSTKYQACEEESARLRQSYNDLMKLYETCISQKNGAEAGERQYQETMAALQASISKERVEAEGRLKQAQAEINRLKLELMKVEESKKVEKKASSSQTVRITSLESELACTRTTLESAQQAVKGYIGTLQHEQSIKEALEHRLATVKSSLTNRAVELAAVTARAEAAEIRLAQAEIETRDLINTTTKESANAHGRLQLQLADLRDEHENMKARAKSVIERYGKNDLTPEESELVKAVGQRWLSITELERASKANELLRLGNVKADLEARVRSLEDSLKDAFAEKKSKSNSKATHDSSQLSTDEPSPDDPIVDFTSGPQIVPTEVIHPSPRLVPVADIPAPTINPLVLTSTALKRARKLSSELSEIEDVVVPVSKPVGAKRVRQEDESDGPSGAGRPARRSKTSTKAGAGETSTTKAKPRKRH